ncbi:MAG: hypothetical protein AB1714_24720 [Acidobacteriota bacterium]
MKPRTMLTVLIGVSMALAIPATALAQLGPYWTHIGAACVVDELDVNDYEVAYEEIYFKAGVTGSIQARCNVTNPDDQGDNPVWDRLGVTFKDPDATGTGARIQAVLKKVTRSTGTSSTVATFDSNRFAGTGWQFQATGVSHTWDFWNYYYYVDIVLSRTSSSLDVRLSGVMLYKLFGASTPDEQQ